MRVAMCEKRVEGVKNGVFFKIWHRDVLGLLWRYRHDPVANEAEQEHAHNVGHRCEAGDPTERLARREGQVVEVATGNDLCDCAGIKTHNTYCKSCTNIISR